jgi:hypothetical protein
MRKLKYVKLFEAFQTDADVEKYKKIHPVGSKFVVAKVVDDHAFDHEEYEIVEYLDGGGRDIICKNFKGEEEEWNLDMMHNYEIGNFPSFYFEWK